MPGVKRAAKEEAAGAPAKKSRPNHGPRASAQASRADLTQEESRAKAAATSISDYIIKECAFRWSGFAPRLFNLCVNKFGMTPGAIMPSRAFCSDENQGYPVILMAKHFGTFPFDHGMVGAVIATERHAPHAHHGKDLVIVHAPHVGYIPSTGEFGSYRRLQAGSNTYSTACGMLSAFITPFVNMYKQAAHTIFLIKQDDEYFIRIDNLLLDTRRDVGLFPNMNLLCHEDQGEFYAERTLSTSKVFRAAPSFVQRLGSHQWKSGIGAPIEDLLTPDLFFYRDNSRHEGLPLSDSMIAVMPQIVTSPYPLLTAAVVHAQLEFDRAYRSVSVEPSYANKKVLLVTGIHVDVSPEEEGSTVFPLTKFIPWAAYYHDENAEGRVFEQDEVVALLREQSRENPRETNLEAAIDVMSHVDEITLPLDNALKQ